MHSTIPYGNFDRDHPVNADIIRRYQSGESSDMIAPDYNTSGGVIRDRLRRWGLIRSRSEAKRLHMARIGPDGRQAITAAAHDAIRGTTRTDADLVARAASRQARIDATPAERHLADLIDQPGKIEFQQAVGPYNVDLAVGGAVAVELFGGRWHTAGRHAARFDQRFGYLFDQGWGIYIVWNTHPKTLMASVGDDFRAWVDEAGGLESLRGQYRVVWGDGDCIASGRHDRDALTAEVARPRRQHLR